MIPWPEVPVPTYRLARRGQWRCVATPVLDRAPGYWRPYPEQPAGWAFRKGRTVWMSLTAMERESHQHHVAAAHGHVVVAGLGMGMYLHAILQKPSVTRVTVLEHDLEVVDLLGRATNLDQWPARWELLMGDALEAPDLGHVDYLYVDIWERLGWDGALACTRSIQARVGAREVGYWGQEYDFMEWIRARELPWHRATQAQYHEFVLSTTMPLVGGQWPEYPRLATAAVVLQCIADHKITNPQARESLLRHITGVLAEPDAIDEALHA